MLRLSGSRPRLIAAGLALALVAGTCGRQAEPEGGPPTEEERPAPRGTIRIGYPEEPPSLNPVETRAPAALDVLRAVLPSFHRITPELTYEPYLLAGEPEVSVQGRRMTVRFRIRDDAVWSDGTPVTVDDVAFTAKVMTEPSLPIAVPDGFDRVTDVLADTATEGRLVLSPPFARWRDLFSAGRFVLPAHVASSPADVAGWREGPPVSGGPFAIRRWIPGRSIVLERNGRFFGPSPLARRIEVAFVPDSTTALQLLEAGLLDAVAPMPGVSWEHRLGRIEDVGVSARFGADAVHLVMNAERLPNLLVRRRIADAIDREPFADAVLREGGRRADGVLVPEQEGSAPAWSFYGSGPRLAVGADRELELVFTRGDLLGLTARFIQAELEAAGVDVELVPVDADVFQATWLPERRFDLALWEARGGPAPWLSRWFEPGEGVSGLDDTALRPLLRRVDHGGAGGERALQAAQRRLARQAPLLPLFQPEVVMAFRSGIEGLEANPSVDGPLWNAWEWWKAEAA